MPLAPGLRLDPAHVVLIYFQRILVGITGPTIKDETAEPHEGVRVKQPRPQPSRYRYEWRTKP